jgi:hypothetical protein
MIPKNSFLKFVQGNFMWTIFFRLCYWECNYVNHNFNAE